jgi:hypothetical protein
MADVACSEYAWGRCLERKWGERLRGRRAHQLTIGQDEAAWPEGRDEGLVPLAGNDLHLALEHDEQVEIGVAGLKQQVPGPCRSLYAERGDVIELRTCAATGSGAGLSLI